MFIDKAVQIVEDYDPVTSLSVAPNFIKMEEFKSFGGEVMCLITLWDKDSLDPTNPVSRVVSSVGLSSTDGNELNFLNFHQMEARSVAKNSGMQIAPFYVDDWDKTLENMIFIFGRANNSSIVKRAWLAPVELVKRSGTFKKLASGYTV